MGRCWSWLPLATALIVGGCAPAGQNSAESSTVNNTGVLNVADAAIAGGDPAMALQVSQSVLAADPHDLQALYHEAAAYYAAGRCEDAMAAYKVALGIDPQSSEAQTGLGRCLLQHDAIAAEQAFAAAVADDPGNAPALNDLGIARDLLGNFAGATPPYQQALLLSPGNTGIEVNLGLSLALSGDPQDALEYLGPLANGPDATPKIREDYATALLAAGQSDQARQVLAVDVPEGQLDTAMATLSSLITQLPFSPPAPAAAPAPPVAAAPVAAAPVAAAPVAAAPIAAAALAPPTPIATTPMPAAPTPIAAALPTPIPPTPAPAPAAPPANAVAMASLPLADTPAPDPSTPVAPTALVTLAPAIPGPAVTAPPPPALTPLPVRERH